ncbi:MAG TPA: deaminase [Bacteroidetes bacterium]|nr:deaminase [Bacteroidota bacterium]HRK04631.1 dihydrofolate reductase family protein [Chlorobiota bacterium]
MTTGHVFIAQSLDGYIARPDGAIDWLMSIDTAGEDHGYHDFISTIDCIVMGRGTFEMALSFELWPYDKPVIVVSSTLSSADIADHLRDKVRVSHAAPRDLMMELSRDGFHRAYVDGGKVIQSFLRDGLIQDMVITTIPVLLGAGRPLFGDVHRDIHMKHISSRSFPSGLVQSTYNVDVTVS